MQYEFKYHSDKDFLEVVVTGDVPKEILNSLAAEGFEQLKKNNCKKYLLNYTGLSNIIGTFDMYERPNEVSKIGINNQYTMALLTNEKDYAKFRFAETVYRNRGYNYKVFIDKDAAIKYLTDDTNVCINIAT